jgi:hypothetical protein
LFKAGQRPGVLSRQAGEPIISYISRRKRWYDLLKQLDPKLEIPSTLRGELLLDHANLTQAEKLMVMTSTFNSLEFDVISEALVKQHAISHSLRSNETQHRKGKGKGWARSYYGAEDWTGCDESMYQRDETEAYFTEACENDWQEDESYAWYADDQWDMTWESAEASWYPETAWYGEASLYPERAWYGEDSSWNEGSCQDRYEEIVDNYFSEAKDAEQIAMEVQSAYLAGEHNGTEPAVTYKGTGKSPSKGYGKGYSKGKGKGFGKHKGKGYSKGAGKKGYKSRPGDLSLEDRRKRLEELKKKTKCQACGQIGHWAGDNVCPKKKAIANLAVHTPGKCDDGLMLPMSHDEDSRSLMAVRRTVSKKPERASSKSSVQHIDSDHNIDVMSSGEEAQTLRVVQRSESGEWQLTTPPPSSPEGAAEKRAMARKMKDVPLKETKMKLGKHRGSTYEMVVLNDPNVQGRDEHIEKTQG